MMSDPALSPTSASIESARALLAEGWAQRAAEYGRPTPTDLGGSCKFAALLAQRLFGGAIRANWHHTWLELDGRIIDLTDGAGVPDAIDRYRHDDDFAAHAEFAASLRNCEARVERWLTGPNSIRTI
jgi:hypothetical protein